MVRDDIFINNILDEAKNTGNFKLIMDNLSFEERKKVLLDGSNVYSAVFLNYYVIYSNLFTEEEAEQLYSSLDNSYNINDLIYACSDSFKLKKISEYTGSLSNFILTFDDDDLRLRACQILLEENRLDSYSINSILMESNSLFLEKFFDIWCENYRVNSEYHIGFYDLSNIFSNVDSVVQLDMMDKVFQLCMNTNKEISYFGMDNLIKCFLRDKQLSILDILILLNKNQKIKNFDYGLSSILKSVDEEQKIDFFERYLINGLLDNFYGISSLYEMMSDNLKDNALEVLYQYEKNTSKKIMKSFDMSSIIMLYEETVRENKFKEFVLDSDRFDDFEVIRTFPTEHDVFSFLNFKIKNDISNIDDDKKKIYFQKINEFIGADFLKLPNGEVKYSELVDLYSESLDLNKEHLILFIERFGYVSLKFLDNKNIRDIINFNDKSFSNLMMLFCEENTILDDNALNSAITSILPKEFIGKCSDDYNIYNNLLTMINNKRFDDVQECLLKIIDYVDIQSVFKTHGIDLERFLEGILLGKKGMIDVLHEITNEYVGVKKDEYVSKRAVNIKDELDLEKKVERNFLKKEYVSNISANSILFAITFYIFDDELNKEQLFLSKNDKLLNKIIDFKKSKKSPKEYGLSNEEIKYIKVFDSILDILYDKKELIVNVEKDKAKYVYYPKKVSDEYLLGVLCELCPSGIDKFLLNDDELFSKLEGIFNKYKLLGWNSTFSSLENGANFCFDIYTLVGIINYFYKIYLDDFKNKSFNLLEFIGYGNSYISASSKYSLLLGRDVYKLLSVNGGRNKATMERYKRLELGDLHVVDMYKRDSIPVPPMDLDIELSNGKMMNVEVGVTTNMFNMVLGEATDSCMRIGGTFYDFYKECLFGKNGFHIVFTDSKTGNFISRVSGLRNGNTVFLNELRESVCQDYTNDDCVSMLKIVSDMLIEKSKNSEFPIDNVVVTSDCAMAPYKEQLQCLNLVDRNKALYGLRHNLNSEGSAIVLSTSRDDNKLVEVVIGEDKITYYKPQREKIRIYDGKDALYRVIQLESLINNRLNGVELADISVDMNQDVVKSISGGDWFISIDSKGEIKEFLLDGSLDKESARKEMKFYLEKLENNFNLEGRSVMTR